MAPWFSASDLLFAKKALITDVSGQPTSTDVPKLIAATAMYCSSQSPHWPTFGKANSSKAITEMPTDLNIRFILISFLVSNMSLFRKFLYILLTVPGIRRLDCIRNTTLDFPTNSYFVG
jgi:hypothetical protein